MHAVPPPSLGSLGVVFQNDRGMLVQDMILVVREAVGQLVDIVQILLKHFFMLMPVIDQLALVTYISYPG